MSYSQASRLAPKKKQPVKNAPDFLLILMILVIVGFGIIMVYSASFYYATTKGSAPASFAIKQLVIGSVGLVVMMAVALKFDYRILSNMLLAKLLYYFSILLCISVIFIGEEVNGATRWLKIGPLQFQPSEIAKIGVVIMLSAYMVKHKKRMHQPLYILKAWLIIFIPTIIIAKENLSSAIVVFLIGAMIVFVGSKNVKGYILLVVIGFILCVGVYYLAMSTEPGQEINVPIIKHILKPYRLDRIRVWKDPWLDPVDKGYQPIQSLYAVGSGGLFGVGLGKGVQKQGFLPEPHNDIIFAVICEETGLIGAIILLTGYTILVIRGLIIAMRASDYFGTLVAVGITSMVGVQVLINVAVNTNTIPTTGMQLPLVSYGGTALAMLLATLGILLNISRTADVRKLTR